MPSRIFIQCEVYVATAAGPRAMSQVEGHSIRNEWYKFKPGATEKYPRKGLPSELSVHSTLYRVLCTHIKNYRPYPVVRLWVILDAGPTRLYPADMCCTCTCACHVVAKASFETDKHEPGF